MQDFEFGRDKLEILCGIPFIPFVAMGFRGGKPLGAGQFENFTKHFKEKIYILGKCCKIIKFLTLLLGSFHEIIYDFKTSHFPEKVSLNFQGKHQLSE